VRLKPVLAGVMLGWLAAPLVSFAGLATIREDDMRRHVAFLAADELAGRETGEPSIAIAERYVATAFESYGLEPLPGHEFTVPFALYRRGYDEEATGVRVGERECRTGRDCKPFTFSGSGEQEAAVVFGGYGIHAPEQGWDDYAGLDVEGKIVLLMRHGPGEGNPEMAIEGRHQQFAVKARVARKQGAVGMLLLTDPLNHDGSDDFRVGGRLTREPSPRRPPGGEDDDDAILAVHISAEFASALVSDSGHSLEQLQAALNAGTRPADLPIGAPTARVTVAVNDEPEPVAARNVVGLLPGSDPVLRDEWVVVGAHHDHVGAYTGGGDTIFNGADDNASGVSGVLELAQAFAARENRPKRTLVFATFSGEEKGLLGSRALVEETLPLDKLVFMLNLDMIGRNSGEQIRLFGDGYVRGLKPLVEEAWVDPSLDLAFAGDAHSANSDHDPFYREGVPFMFLFTGTHEDYHQIGDHASKLDYSRMRSITRLSYRVLDQWGDLDDALTFIHHVPWLGITVEKQDLGEESFAEVTWVEEGSRAADAGLLAGDRLASLDGKSFERPGRAGKSFDEVEAGSTVELAWMREGEALSADVERVRPGYMGVVTGDVDDETRAEHGLAHGEGLALTSVVPDGPSDKAGLEDDDIVLRMGGRPVDERTLTRRLMQIGAGAEVPLDVLRDGERIEIVLTTGERPRR